MYYDVHCHLTDKSYEDIDNVIKELEKNNVIAIINGLNYKDNEKVRKLCEKSNNLFFSYGMFPLDKFDKKVFTQIRKDSPVAIGEVGIDFSKEEKNIPLQIKHFLEIVKLAEELDKPLIIHSRNAEKEIVELLPKIKVPCILHYFCGKKSLINQVKELPNVYFTISANSKYNSHEQMKIKLVPIQKLLCETDSPYLWKYGINSPLNVRFAYLEIAKIKKISLKKTIEIIEKTTKELFKL